MSFFPSPPPPIHRDAHAVLLICLLIGLVGLIFWWPIALLGFGAAAAVYMTYRDPERIVPQRPGLVVSPADGYVLFVRDDVPLTDLEMGPEPRPHIAISIGTTDNHVNRMPVDGIVERVSYRPGLYLNHKLDAAIDFNERQSIRVHTPSDGVVGIVQIAGILARRIVATVKEGDQVVTGERFGLIRFGSRVDIYLPAGVSVLVTAGQRMVGGETVIADFASGEGQRAGAVR